MDETDFETMMEELYDTINDGVVLMDYTEEFKYKRDLVEKIKKDLDEWLSTFPRKENS
jgi:hypothetical protein